jgi:hypothetical protein
VLDAVRVTGVTRQKQAFGCNDLGLVSYTSAK